MEISGRQIKALATYVKTSSKGEWCHTSYVVLDNGGYNGGVRLWCTDGHAAVLYSPPTTVKGPDKPMLYPLNALTGYKVRDVLTIGSEGIRDDRGLLPLEHEKESPDIDQVIPAHSENSQGDIVQCYDPRLFHRLMKCLESVAIGKMDGSDVPSASRFQFSEDKYGPCRIDYGEDIVAVIMPCRL